MTVLSAQSIRRRRGVITPFHERAVAFGMTYGLGPAGYDIRIAQNLVLMPGDGALASSIERFDIPEDLVCRVYGKSTWRRRFIHIGEGTIFEPGWRGWPTLEIENRGKDRVSISAGMPIAQVMFDLLDQATQQPYGAGRYQDQPAQPVGPIYGLEVAA
jgi:dCTP deaminase